MTAASAVRPVRRDDPGRRDRIIDACLDVIARDGVAGTSHRKVAAEADVPLGSMTYHFGGMDDLLTEAFTRFADRSAAATEQRLDRDLTREETVAAVAALIEDGAAGSSRDLAITHELYTLAARRPSFAAIARRWMARNRRTLRRHVDPDTAVLLDALVEGLTLHQALAPDTRDHDLTCEAVRRVLTPRPPATGAA